MAGMELEAPPVAQMSGPATGAKPTSRTGLTILERDDSLEGKLAMKGDGRVLGRFHGEIESAGELTVGPEAEVAANIRGSSVTISGLVRGNVFVTGRMTLNASARLFGDARVGSLVVNEGAVHRGAIEVHPEGFDEPESEVTPVPADDGQAVGAAAMERVKKLWGEFF